MIDDGTYTTIYEKWFKEAPPKIELRRRKRSDAAPEAGLG